VELLIHQDQGKLPTFLQYVYRALNLSSALKSSQALEHSIDVALAAENLVRLGDSNTFARSQGDAQTSPTEASVRGHGHYLIGPYKMKDVAQPECM
jgi:hypothetical protein